MNGILTDCFLYIRAAVKKLSSTLDHFLQGMYVCKACINCNVSWTVVLKSSLENATFIPLLNPITQCKKVFHGLESHSVLNAFGAG